MLQRWPHGGELLTGPDEAEIRALAVAPVPAAAAWAGRCCGGDRLVPDARACQHLLLLTQTDMKAAHHLYEEAGFSRLPERDWYPSRACPAGLRPVVWPIAAVSGSAPCG